MVARRYDAFIVRRWRTPAGEQRLEIEHIQSGTKARCASTATATAWLHDRAIGPADAFSDDADDNDDQMLAPPHSGVGVAASAPSAAASIRP